MTCRKYIYGGESRNVLVNRTWEGGSCGVWTGDERGRGERMGKGETKTQKNHIKKARSGEKNKPIL